MLTPQSSSRFRPNPPPITLFRDQNYKVNAAIEIYALDLKLTVTVLDTGAGPNLIKLRILPDAWTHRIQPANIGGLVAAARQRVPLTGLIFLYVQLGDLRARVWFGVID